MHRLQERFDYISEELRESLSAIEDESLQTCQVCARPVCAGLTCTTSDTVSWDARSESCPAIGRLTYGAWDRGSTKRMTASPGSEARMASPSSDGFAGGSGGGVAGEASAGVDAVSAGAATGRAGASPTGAAD